MGPTPSSTSLSFLPHDFTQNRELIAYAREVPPIHTKPLNPTFDIRDKALSASTRILLLLGHWDNLPK
jgi:hypothetical protein